jgi:hypothetical protein
MAHEREITGSEFDADVLPWCGDPSDAMKRIVWGIEQLCRTPGVKERFLDAIRVSEPWDRLRETEEDAQRRAEAYRREVLSAKPPFPAMYAALAAIHDAYLFSECWIVRGTGRNWVPFSDWHRHPFSDQDAGRLLEEVEKDLIAEGLLPDAPGKLSRDRQAERPYWDGRTLWLGDRICKRFSRPAENQRTLLTAFEEEKWEECIDDPLPPKAGTTRAARRWHTVRDLNRSVVLLRFRCDGTRVCWERCSLPAP